MRIRIVEISNGISKSSDQRIQCISLGAQKAPYFFEVTYYHYLYTTQLLMFVYPARV